MVIAQVRIALVDALHIKSAELWLRLGEPLQALRELERLSRRARRHPWAEAVFKAAFGTLREPGYFESLSDETRPPATAGPFLERKPALGPHRAECKPALPRD